MRVHVWWSGAARRGESGEGRIRYLPPCAGLSSQPSCCGGKRSALSRSNASGGRLGRCGWVWDGCGRVVLVWREDGKRIEGMREEGSSGGEGETWARGEEEG